MKVRVKDQIRREAYIEKGITPDMTFDEYYAKYGMPEVGRTTSYILAPGHQISIAPEFMCELMMKELHMKESTPKAVIKLTPEQGIKMNELYNEKYSKSDAKLIKALPYDDVIVQVGKENEDTANIRVVITNQITDKDIAECTKRLSFKYLGYMIIDVFTYGVDTFSKYLEGEDDICYVAIPIMLIRARNSTLQIGFNFPDGVFRYSDDPEKRKRFRDVMLKSTPENPTTYIRNRLITWLSVMWTLKSPEVIEKWLTVEDLPPYEADTPENKIFRGMYKAPLKNEKIIYRGEHQTTGKEYQRHTDKWAVKGHEVHLKNGTTFWRKGHYKGPKAHEEDVKVEPRERTVDTQEKSTLDRNSLNDFFNDMMKN